jgi:hypothetical protein
MSGKGCRIARAEDATMNPSRQRFDSHTAARRHAECLETIRGCQYLAGYKMAVDDARERSMADLAVARLTALGPGQRQPTRATMRQVVGGTLIRLGTRVAGARPAGSEPRSTHRPSPATS